MAFISGLTKRPLRIFPIWLICLWLAFFSGQPLLQAQANPARAPGLPAQNQSQNSVPQSPASQSAQPQGEAEKDSAKPVLKTLERPMSTRSTAHLYEIIIRETPLIKQEIEIYGKNLESIVALDQDPSGLQAVLDNTGWSLERFTYVVTKIGVGLSNILYPENPRLINASDFLSPTPAERELIIDQLKTLVKSYQDLVKTKPPAKANKGGK
ncbi:MAG: hypothetical protein LBS44_06495 [Deltaproteobacteria bacterium]|jgi:hypothetical protein|nr:hypothetical protein [Deltaproteobacteria bacterium]